MKRAMAVFLVGLAVVVAIWKPALPVAATPSAPLLTSPEDGATLETFGPTLTWSIN